MSDKTGLLPSTNLVAEAHARATKLGHLALKQRTSWECARCGASGTCDADGNLRGGVFKRECGS